MIGDRGRRFLKRRRAFLVEPSGPRASKKPFSRSARQRRGRGNTDHAPTVEHDRGHALAGKNTLELAAPIVDGATRYKKISYDGHAIEQLFVSRFLDAHERPRGEIIIDLDATDDPIHDEQEARGSPLLRLLRPLLLGATLNTNDGAPGKQTLAELERIIS